jgi:hypothetical protein
MTRSTRWAVLAILAAGAALAAARQDEEPEGVVNGTSGLARGNWEVTAGGLVLVEGKPTLVFGTVRKGRPQHELSYFAIVRSRFKASAKVDIFEKTFADDTSGESRQLFAVDGAKLTVTYKIGHNAGRVLRESIVVNGKSLDPRKGRVLLVDLTARPPTWTQRNLPLPATVPEAREKKVAAALARKVLDELKKDRGVRAFVEAAGK